MYIKSLVLFGCVASHSIASVADILGPTCQKIPDAVGPKLDVAYDHYYKSICSHGCKPIVGGRYTSLVSETILKPAVEIISNNLGIEQDRIETFLMITDESMKAVEQQCSDLVTTDFCQDTGAFPKYASCAKGQIFSVIISHALDVAPLVSEEACQKEMEYFQKPDLWDIALPSFVTNFWSICEKW